MFIAVCLGLLIQAPSLAAGDSWKSERTYRYLNEEEHVDVSQTEETEYRVDSVDAHGTKITQTRTSKTGDQVDPVVRTLVFGPGGVPSYAEDPQNAVAARVDRIQWSAAEDRAGVSWTRKFRPAGTLPGAKLTMRPTGASADSQTIAVTYDEDGHLVKGEATITVSLPKRVVTSIKMTLTGVEAPGKGKTAKVAVSQKLVARDSASKGE